MQELSSGDRDRRSGRVIDALPAIFRVLDFKGWPEIVLRLDGDDVLVSTHGHDGKTRDLILLTTSDKGKEVVQVLHRFTVHRNDKPIAVQTIP